jgi:osmotically-inducible protein OsmY
MNARKRIPFMKAFLSVTVALVVGSIVVLSAPAQTTTKNASDDAALQARIDKAFADDSTVSTAAIDATVVNARVRLSGTANSEAIKQRAERLAYAVKGVLGVENKIAVPAGP